MDILGVRKKYIDRCSNILNIIVQHAACMSIDRSPSFRGRVEPQPEGHLQHRKHDEEGHKHVPEGLRFFVFANKQTRHGKEKGMLPRYSSSSTRFPEGKKKKKKNVLA